MDTKHFAQTMLDDLIALMEGYGMSDRVIYDEDWIEEAIQLVEDSLAQYDTLKG